MIEEIKVRLNVKDVKNRMTFNPQTGQVVLYADKKRILGNILFEGIPVYYKREDELQIHRNTNGWSINLTVLKAVKLVRYETSDAIYEIKSGKAFSVGKTFGWDAKNGIDRKVFVSLNHFDIVYKDKKEDARMRSLGIEWYKVLKSEFEKDYMKKLNNFVALRRKDNEVFPERGSIFKAFEFCQPINTRVVIISSCIDRDGGGLLMSTLDPEGNDVVNAVMAEIRSDIYDDLPVTLNTELTRLAKQGVLLLNHVLTRDNDYHNNKGWERFVRKSLELLNEKYENIVYLFWGEQALQYKEVINGSKNLVLSAPMPGSSGFYGSGHFSAANDYLVSKGKGEIFW